MPIEAKRPTTVFRFQRPLDAIVAPRNVAVIGATGKAGSVGRTTIDVDNRDPQIVSGRVGFTVSLVQHEQLMKARLDL